MGWANYVDGQTEGAIKHPASFVSATVIFGVITGERLAELHGKSANSGDYFFLLLFAFLPLWGSYFLARAIRQLRDGSKPSSPAPRNDLASPQ